MVEPVGLELTASGENLKSPDSLTGALKGTGPGKDEAAKRASAVRFADGVKDAAEVDMTEERVSANDQ